MRADRRSSEGGRLGCEEDPVEICCSWDDDGGLDLVLLVDALRLDKEYLRRPRGWPLCMYQRLSLQKVSKCWQ